MTTIITIAGREFTVTPDKPDDEGRPSYRLTGKRGADYRTFRNVPKPDRMFLVGFRKGSFNVDPLGPVWLTDADGTLRVVS